MVNGSFTLSTGHLQVQGWLGSGTGSLDLTGSTRDNQQIGLHFVQPEL